MTTVSHERALALLRGGEMELLGIMQGASNYTFAVRVTAGEDETIAVYKPQRGETPLWDFPQGTLYKREVAAYELSQALGLDIVPPTIMRQGIHGIGSVQFFIDVVPEQHYFTLMPARADDFRVVAAFDMLANNADRKGGHCLLENETGRVWFIDHGVCFHVEDKLRTVIWEFAGEPLPEQVRAALEAFVMPPVMTDLLTPEECDALEARRASILSLGVFPEQPDDRRSYPWPPV